MACVYSYKQFADSKWFDAVFDYYFANKRNINFTKHQIYTAEISRETSPANFSKLKKDTNNGLKGELHINAIHFWDNLNGQYKYDFIGSALVGEFVNPTKYHIGAAYLLDTYGASIAKEKNKYFVDGSRDVRKIAEKCRQIMIQQELDAIFEPYNEYKECQVITKESVKAK